MISKNSKTFGRAFIISMILLCIGFLSATQNVVFAEGAQPSFESYTDTNDYYYNGDKYDIKDYAQSMQKDNAVNYILAETLR